MLNVVESVVSQFVHIFGTGFSIPQARAKGKVNEVENKDPCNEKSL